MSEGYRLTPAAVRRALDERAEKLQRAAVRRALENWGRLNGVA